MFSFFIVKSLVFNFFPKTPSSDRTQTLTYKLQIDMRPQNASTIVFYAVSQCPAGKTTPTTNPQHCINARIEKTTKAIPLLAKYLFTLCDDVLVDYFRNVRFMMTYKFVVRFVMTYKSAANGQNRTYGCLIHPRMFNSSDCHIIVCKKRQNK